MRNSKGQFVKGNSGTPKGINSFVVKGDLAYLFLTQDKKTLIDRRDLERVLDYRWDAQKRSDNWYARNLKIGYLHQFLTGNKLTDHFDQDGLNNRRYNLRNTTSSENGQNSRLRRDNTTGYRGVSLHRDGKFEELIRLIDQDIPEGM